MPFSGIIASNDKVWFICELCHKETSKAKKRIDEKYPYCEKCLRKIKLKEKYGVENVFQLPLIKKKIIDTNMKKY